MILIVILLIKTKAKHMNRNPFALLFFLIALLGCQVLQAQDSSKQLKGPRAKNKTTLVAQKNHAKKEVSSAYQNEVVQGPRAKNPVPQNWNDAIDLYISDGQLSRLVVKGPRAKVMRPWQLQNIDTDIRYIQQDDDEMSVDSTRLTK